MPQEESKNQRLVPSSNLQKSIPTIQAYSETMKKSFETYSGGVVPTISHLMCPFDTTDRSDVLVNTDNKMKCTV